MSNVTDASRLGKMANGAYDYVFLNKDHNFVGGVLYLLIGFFAARLNQAVVECFRGHQIEIPYPQREIRIFNAPAPPEPSLHEYGHASR